MYIDTALSIELNFSEKQMNKQKKNLRNVWMGDFQLINLLTFDRSEYKRLIGGESFQVFNASATNYI